VSPLTVCVDRNQRGDWEFGLPDEAERITCETLDEARRVAYLCARRQPCEFVVRDAYHRVLYRELLDNGSEAQPHRPSVVSSRWRVDAPSRRGASAKGLL
jgi:hypothetical protein